MTALHLPVAHTEDDIALAGALAQMLCSEELYVAWSTDGGAAKPVVDANLELADARPQSAAPGPIPTLYDRLRDLWRKL